MTSTTTKNIVPDIISKENWKLLSTKGQKALKTLIQHDIDDGAQAQTHVYTDWPDAGTDDDGKIHIADQLAHLDESYPGGLTSYLTKAKTLLRESSENKNPFDDYIASIPTGEYLSYEDDDTQSNDGMTFQDAERLGLTVIADTAFVLVAGGLGERLGYSGIKLSLETNLCTNNCYLEMYVRYIQALQRMAETKLGRENVRIPLVIMTSGDTDPLTRKLLKEHDNFGMKENQIQIICQDKVAALKDSNAGLSMKNRWEIETKPHGHGDVHHLLHKHGHVEKWEKEGKKYVILLQDTNLLTINSVIPTLGVSVKKGFHMNSLCIPRLAGEAIGGIAKLEHKTDPEKSLVINVEYNQLGPLLSTQGDCKGDVPDPDTGYSAFPGNINILLLEVSSYAKTLRGKDQGVVTEFVNPKYKDESRTEFKKPTRLECMMQDFPKLLQTEMGREATLGFTTFDRWFTFSPAKNSLESGIETIQKNSKAPPFTMSSAESDEYIQNQRKLAHAGFDVPLHSVVSLGGIPVTPGPRIVLDPSFAMTRDEIVEKVVGGTMTQRSSLVLEGKMLVIKDLNLDGALVIRVKEGCEVEVDGLVVKNKGWELKELEKGEDVEEELAIRGYKMVKHETKEIEVMEPGKYRVGKDGIVEKLD